MEAITETPIFAPLFNRKHLKFGLWCNGSTTGFGSVCPGSNPGSPTNKDSDIPRECRSFCFQCVIVSSRNRYKMPAKHAFRWHVPFLNQANGREKQPSCFPFRQENACLSGAKCMFSHIRLHVFPRQSVCFPSAKAMFDEGKDYIFPVFGLQSLRFRASDS